MKAQAKVTFRLDDEPPTATWEYKDEQLTISYPSSRDRRYLKHKLAMFLLRTAAFKSNHAFEAYKAVSKSPVFLRGLPIDVQESTHIEFKGSTSPMKPLTSKLLANKQKDIGKSVGAMLNSTTGGSIFLGVNDDRTVCGIEIKGNLDEVELRLMNSLHSKMDPKQPNLIRAVRHTVGVFCVPEPRHPRPVQPSEYAISLEEVLDGVRGFVDRFSRASETQLWVVELMVHPAPKLTMFEGHYVIRRGAQNVDMTHHEVVERILSQYQNQQL
jgi:uncharacterized protein YuzE